MALFMLMFILALFRVSECPLEKLHCSPDEVTAEVGSTVILHCTVSPRNVKTDIVVWTAVWLKQNSDVHVWRNGMNDLVGQNSIFTDRTKLFPEEMSKGNVSLQISNVTHEHNGTYRVSVKEIKLNETVRLIVEKSSEDKKREGKNTNNGDTSLAAIFGILAAVVVAVIICAFVIYCFVKKCNQGNQQDYEPTPTQPHDQGQPIPQEHELTNQEPMELTEDGSSVGPVGAFGPDGCSYESV